MKDVHTEHCCAKHGCKYGDDDCTVTTGLAPQSFDCESCDWEKEQGVTERPRLSVWYGSMPESNGKSNWTAIIYREGECISEGICIDRSEYPERTLYEADKMRYLIGELDVEPWILDYDSDKHSGYVRKES